MRSFHMRGIFACHASRMPLNEPVGAAQQQDMRTQVYARGSNAQILQDDGFEERCHQLVGGCAGLLQAVDVCFGKDAALAGNLMQLDAVVTLVGQARTRGS